MAPEWNRKPQKSPLCRNQWVVPFLTHVGETMLKVKPVRKHSAPPGKVCVNARSSSAIAKAVLDHLWPQWQISHRVPRELSANLHAHGGGWDFSDGVLFGLHCHFCSRIDGAGSWEAPRCCGLSHSEVQSRALSHCCPLSVPKSLVTQGLHLVEPTLRWKHLMTLDGLHSVPYYLFVKWFLLGSF